MAFTFTTLKQAIQDYTESNETSFVNNLPTIIRQAEDKILKTVQLPDFRKNVEGSVAAGSQYLVMPSDFLTPYSLAIDNSGHDYLIFKDVNFIRQAYPVSGTTGAPKYYGRPTGRTRSSGVRARPSRSPRNGRRVAKWQSAERRPQNRLKTHPSPSAGRWLSGARYPRQSAEMALPCVARPEGWLFKWRLAEQLALLLTCQT